MIHTLRFVKYLLQILLINFSTGKKSAAAGEKSPAAAFVNDGHIFVVISE